MEHRSPDTKACAALAFLPDTERVPELLLFIEPGLLRSNAPPSHDWSHEASLRSHALPGWVTRGRRRGAKRGLLRLPAHPLTPAICYFPRSYHFNKIMAVSGPKPFSCCRHGFPSEVRRVIALRAPCSQAWAQHSMASAGLPSTLGWDWAKIGHGSISLIGMALKKNFLQPFENVQSLKLYLSPFVWLPLQTSITLCWHAGHVTRHWAPALLVPHRPMRKCAPTREGRAAVPRASRPLSETVLPPSFSAPGGAHARGGVPSSAGSCCESSARACRADEGASPRPVDGCKKQFSLLKTGTMLKPHRKYLAATNSQSRDLFPMCFLNTFISRRLGTGWFSCLIGVK